MAAGAEQRADADHDRDDVDELRDPEHEGAEQQHADRGLGRPELPFVHGRRHGRGVHAADPIGDFCPTRRLPAQSSLSSRVKAPLRSAFTHGWEVGRVRWAHSGGIGRRQVEGDAVVMDVGAIGQDSVLRGHGIDVTRGARAHPPAAAVEALAWMAPIAAFL